MLYICSIVITLLLLPIILKRFGFLNLHNLYLLYLCILFTYIAILMTYLLLYLYAPNAANLFYLFNFDYIFSMLNLPFKEEIEAVASVTVPTNNEIIDHLAILNKSMLNLNNNLDILVKKQEVSNQLVETLLEQNLGMVNQTVDNLTVMTNHIFGLKENLKSIQNSIEISTKTNINVLNYNFQEINKNLTQLTAISLKHIDVLYSVNDSFVPLNGKLNEIAALTESLKDLNSNGFRSLLESNESNSALIKDWQTKVDLSNKKLYEFRNQNLADIQAMQKDLNLHKVEIKSEVDALKPKESITEAGFFSNTLGKISSVFDKRNS